MTVALIVVDVQNDFADPGGSLYVGGGEVVAAKLASALAQHDSPGDADVVVATRDWHGEHPGTHFDEWPVHCVASTWGAQLYPTLDSWRGFDAYFDKGQTAAAYSGFEGRSHDGDTLHDFLRKREVADVVVVGLATDYCVRATALDAVRLGYRTTLELEFCAGVALETTERAIAEMREHGVAVRESR